jgi:hypothetical protein
MKPEQEYKELYERMATLCAEQKWGDPFSYARSKEIYAAIALGHTVATTLSGADAINAAGQEVEYKSTIGNKVKGSYTGISVQPTWQEQEAYLKDDKIGKYPEHYFNRFSGGKLAESWMMTGAKVLELLTPKLAVKYATVLSKKDPRLGANITWKEIKKYGKQII